MIVGYVSFTLLGCLALLIALGVLADAGIGPLFFICLGIGFSVLGIVAIGTIISSAVLRKNMQQTQIYVYSETKNGQQEILFAYKSDKFSLEQKGYQAFNITENMDTENLVIPESKVYSSKNVQNNLYDFD